MRLGLGADFLDEGVNDDSVVVVGELDIVEDVAVVESIKGGFHVGVEGGEVDGRGFEELFCSS